GLRLPRPLLLRARQPAREPIVLNDRKVQLVVLAKEERARLGACEAARLGQDPVQQRREVPLAREGDADLHEVTERLGEVDRKRHGFSGRHSQRRSTVCSDGAIRFPRASNPGATVLEWGLIPLFSWNQRVKTLPPTKARDHMPRF